MENKIFEITIPSVNREGAVKRIIKLQRKAAKLGLEPVSYTVSDEYFVSVGVDDNGKKIMVGKVDIVITGDTPVLEGWIILAYVERSEDGDIVAPLHEDFVLPVAFRNYSACEHCNTNRARKHTYIIQNVETKEMMQVGKSCMKDFISPEISSIMSYYRYIEELRDDFEDDLLDYSLAPMLFDVDDVLSVALAMVERSGYTPSSWEKSTRDWVSTFISKRNSGIRHKSVFTGCHDKDKELINAQLDNARAMIEWIENNDEDNDFMRSVKTIIKGGWVEAKRFGYVVGAVPAYNRYLEKEIKKKEKVQFADSYYGEIKKRQQMKAQLLSVKVIDGYYGDTYLHNFIGDEGHQLTWFSSSVDLRDEDIEIGNNVVFKATVKGHEEFNGVKQTLITRVKLEA